MSWVFITLFAAGAQGLRTGMQKHLAETVDKTTANFARYIFGLPLLLGVVALGHLGILPKVDLSLRFYLLCLLIASCQLLGTLLMLQVFKLKNYLLGVAFARTEAVLVAIWGLVFFATPLGWAGMVAVCVGVVGVLLLSQTNWQNGWGDFIKGLGSAGLLLGLGSGAAFAFTAWFIRLANQELVAGQWLGPLYTLGISNLMQIVMVLLFMAACGRWRSGWRNIRSNWRLVTGVGLTSILGSWGWYTAYGMAHPAYVKTVGQVEMLLVYFISRNVFSERSSASELLGVLLVVASIVLLLL